MRHSTPRAGGASDVAKPYSHATISCPCPTALCAQAELGNAALPTNTVLDTTRLSASVSTGSHGVGRGWGAVSDLVDSLTIVDGGGRPVVYNASHPYFNQARAAPRPAASSKHLVCSRTGVWLSIPAARSVEQGPVYFHFRFEYRLSFVVLLVGCRAAGAPGSDLPLDLLPSWE